MSEIRHLTDDEIQQLLDGALSAGEAAGARQHLVGCRACARRLEAAAELFATIESWDDRPPSRDLSAAVTRLLKPASRQAGWRLATGLQAAVALAAIVIGWPLIAQLAIPMDLSPLLVVDRAAFDTWPAELAAYAASLEPSALLALDQAEAWVGSAASASAWWPALLAAAAAAIVGNSLLLTRAGGSRFSGSGRS